jgi:hypothetical protein
MTKDQILERIAEIDHVLKYAFDNYGETWPGHIIWPDDDETTESTAAKRYTLYLIRQWMREIAVAVDELTETTV